MRFAWCHSRAFAGFFVLGGGFSLGASGIVAGLAASPAIARSDSADSLLIVDCLLPGRVQRLGTGVTYMTARRAIKTSAADCRLRGGEYTESGEATYASLMRIWLPLAKSGDLEAQTNLGEIFERGIGGPPQPDLALQWYRLAADKGFARAQVDLGSMYERGNGVPQDTAMAMEWYRRASGLAEMPVAAASVQELSRLRQERDTLSRQLEAERQRREALEKELDGVTRQLGGERSSLLEQQRQLDQARAALVASSRAFEAQKAELTGGQGDAVPPQLLDLQLQLTAQRKSVEERDNRLRVLQASVTQLEGRSRTLEAQLAASEKQRVTDAASARDEVGRARAELADVSARLRRSDEALNSQLTTLKEQQAAVSQLKQQLATQQAGSSGGQAERARLETTLRAREAELTESRKQLAALNAEIAQLEQQSKAAAQTVRASSGGQAAAPVLPRNVDFGRYYALVIGNNDHRFIPKLKTAVGDAQSISDLLRTRYGFEVTLLVNANRYAILSALNQMREKLTSQDNLLIYYAGHGTVDPENDRGYWLPIDAEANSSANWIPSYQITDILKAMSAKQVMLVADSCYSGMLTRSALTRLDTGMTEAERQRWFRAMTTKHARVVLTSGGVQPVLDGGGGGHSVFAAAFIRALQDNQDVLEGQRLAQEVTRRVAVSAAAARLEQVPIYAPLGHAGHEAGDFFFVPR